MTAELIAIALALYALLTALYLLFLYALFHEP